MTEHVFERARRRTVEREKALRELWRASVAVAECPSDANLRWLRATVKTIKCRMSPPPPPPSNPKSPWATS